MSAGLIVGFLGAYTTFSAFSLETFRLIDEGAATSALAYVAVSVSAGLAAAVAGFLLGRTLSA